MYINIYTPNFKNYISIYIIFHFFPLFIRQISINLEMGGRSIPLSITLIPSGEADDQPKVYE